MSIRNIVLGYLVFFATIIIFFDGTGDTGDSITHYLHAKYALKYPELFVDQWSKPVFTFLSVLFAQSGFATFKIFNGLMFLLGAFFSYKVAAKLGLKNAPLAAMFCFLSPLSLSYVFSGLTEYTFNALLIISIYFITIKRVHWGILIVSFLPFVRTEGLLMIGVFFIYLNVQKRHALTPLLLTGHLFYSIAGAWHHGDIFWLFTSNPNATFDIMYGAGSFLYFFVIEYHMLGPIIGLLVIVGLVKLAPRYKEPSPRNMILLLIMACFLIFFIAHGTFHHFGIFKSMGQKRVMIATTSLTAIMALAGFNRMNSKNWKLTGVPLANVLLIITLAFPFSTLPGSISWKEYIFLREEQKVALDAVDFATESGLLKPDTKLFCNYPTIFLYLNRDPFSNLNSKLDHSTIKNVKEGDMVIWDSWFSVHDMFFTEKNLQTYPNLIEFKRFTYHTPNKDWFFIVLKSE